VGKPTGPPPKLNELRAIEGGTARTGTLSHRPKPDVVLLAPRVEKHAMPEAPVDIPREGRELWETVVPWLVEQNAVQLIDLPAVKSMCIHYAQAEKLRRVLDEQGYFVLGSQGQMTEHPAMRQFNNCSAMFLRYAQEFGLTTVARTRLGLMDVQRRSIAQEMDWTLGPATRRPDVEAKGGK